MAKGIEYEEVLVAGDDRCTAAGGRGAQHDVVTSIPAHRRLEGFGRDQREPFLEQATRCAHVARTLAELPRKDIAQLVEQWLRREDGVLAHAVLQQLRTRAPGDECRDLERLHLLIRHTLQLARTGQSRHADFRRAWPSFCWRRSASRQAVVPGVAGDACP